MIDWSKPLQTNNGAKATYDLSKRVVSINARDYIVDIEGNSTGFYLVNTPEEPEDTLLLLRYENVWTLVFGIPVTNTRAESEIAKNDKLELKKVKL